MPGLFCRRLWKWTTLAPTLHKKHISSLLFYRPRYNGLIFNLPGNIATIYFLRHISWWRHLMETFSALLDLWYGNPPVAGGFNTQMPVPRSFEVFFDVGLKKRLSKQSRRRWFETPLRSLMRRCNVKCPGDLQTYFTPLRWKRSIGSYGYYIFVSQMCTERRSTTAVLCENLEKRFNYWNGCSVQKSFGVIWIQHESRKIFHIVAASSSPGWVSPPVLAAPQYRHIAPGSTKYMRVSLFILAGSSPLGDIALWDHRALSPWEDEHANINNETHGLPTSRHVWTYFSWLWREFNRIGFRSCFFIYSFIRLHPQVPWCSSIHHTFIQQSGVAHCSNHIQINKQYPVERNVQQYPSVISSK